MYQVQGSGTLLQVHRRLLARGGRRHALVSRTVVMLGLTSLFTDISSEMVATVLPLYLVYAHGFTPLQLGLVDGIYQGASALVRVASGFVADRSRRYKEAAVAGYGLSALCRIGLLTAGSGLTAIGGIVLADRTGKGVRTAPRDAMISLTSRPESLGIAFGVHRAMDTMGAMLGPLLAFAILAAAPLAFHSLFMVSLCFAVLGVAILVLFVDRTPARAATAEAPSLRGAAALLNDSRFRALVLAGGALGLMTASDAFVYLGLREHVDISASLFPLMYTGTALIFMALAVPIGRLADRAGRMRVFVGGYVLLLAVYALVLAPGLGALGVLGALAMMGVYYASTDGVLAALASSVLPEDLRASGLALVATATGLAQLLASVVLGSLWTAFGPATAFACFAAGLVAALGGATTFVGGHSYGTPGRFSTATQVVDLRSGRALGNLERWTVTRGAGAFHAADFNFWGLTFARDDDTIYATLGTGSKTYLVRGSIRARAMTVLHENVECPSLSPDGTRIAYKKKVGGPPAVWRFYVLDLRTMRETPLAETRTIDDQIAWLDDLDVMYGVDETTWTVPADGTGTPREVLAGGDSPQAVR